MFSDAVSALRSNSGESGALASEAAALATKVAAVMRAGAADAVDEHLAALGALDHTVDTLLRRANDAAPLAAAAKAGVTNVADCRLQVVRAMLTSDTYLQSCSPAARRTR